MKKSTFFLILFVVFMIARSSDANVLFHEDFNTGTSSIIGVPTIASAGIDNDWYGARFAVGGGGLVSNLVGVSPFGHTPADNRYGFFSDDTALLFHISTLGYSDVTLSFDWATSALTTASQPVAVGYFTGDITGFDLNRAIDLTDPTDPASWSNWNSTVLGISNELFIHQTINLPSNESDVWVAFTIQNGFKRFGQIDNVEVTGSVPEPSSLSLLAMGVLGLIQRNKKNNKREIKQCLKI